MKTTNSRKTLISWEMSLLFWDNRSDHDTQTFFH
jgi:hypothetical protein